MFEVRSIGQYRQHGRLGEIVMLGLLFGMDAAGGNDKPLLAFMRT